MTGGQVVRKVELPCALPLIMSGIRSAALQVIATVTVAAYLPFLGGLGRYIKDGAGSLNDTQTGYPAMVAAGITVAVLAVVVDALFNLLQRADRLARSDRTGQARQGPGRRAVPGRCRRDRRTGGGRFDHCLTTVHPPSLNDLVSRRSVHEADLRGRRHGSCLAGPLGLRQQWQFGQQRPGGAEPVVQHPDLRPVDRPGGRPAQPARFGDHRIGAVRRERTARRPLRRRDGGQGRQGHQAPRHRRAARLHGGHEGRLDHRLPRVQRLDPAVPARARDHRQDARRRLRPAAAGGRGEQLRRHQLRGRAGLGHDHGDPGRRRRSTT